MNRCPVRPDVHRIAALSYQHDRLTCTCGETMSAAHGQAWREHRNRLGLRVVSVGQSIGKRVRARV